jgi:hypothetical protein
VTRNGWLALALALGVPLLAGRDFLFQEAFPGDPGVPDAAHTPFIFHFVADALRLRHGLTWCSDIWFPAGYPFLLSVQNILDALLAAPLIWTLGVARGVAWWTWAALASNGVAGAWLGRRFGGDAGALLGAAVMALCPYAFGEVNDGRITQAWLAPAAVSLALATDAARGERPGWQAGVALALCGYAYWFHVPFLAIGIVALVIGEAGWRKGTATLVEIAGVSFLCVLPFALWVAHNWPMMPGLVGQDRRPLGSRIFTGLGGVGPGDHLTVPQGWWVLAAAGAATAGRRRGPLLLAAAAFIAVLSLGATYRAFGHRFVLPFAWMQLLPAMRRFWWPYRALGPLYVVLVPLVALAAARWRALGLAGVVGAVVQVARWPGFMSCILWDPVGSWNTALPPGPVVVIPLFDPDAGRRALLTQPLHSRPVVNGMGMWAVNMWPPTYVAFFQAQPMLASMASNAPPGEPAPGWVEALAATGVVGVIIDREDLESPEAPFEPALEVVRSLLGEATCVEGEGECWWAVPGADPAAKAWDPPLGVVAPPTESPALTPPGMAPGSVAREPPRER